MPVAQSRTQAPTVSGPATKRGLLSKLLPVFMAMARDSTTTRNGARAEERICVGSRNAPDIDSGVGVTFSDGSLAFPGRRRGLRGPREAVNQSAGHRVRGSSCVQPVNSCHSQFMLPLMPLTCGVVTKCLRRYINWFQQLDCSNQPLPERHRRRLNEAAHTIHEQPPR